LLITVSGAPVAAVGCWAVAIGAKAAAPTVPTSPLTTARRDAPVFLFMLFPPFRRMTATSRLNWNIGCWYGHASNGRAAVASAQVAVRQVRLG
jgi:hypothetical protein